MLTAEQKADLVACIDDNRLPAASFAFQRDQLAHLAELVDEWLEIQALGGVDAYDGYPPAGEPWTQADIGGEAAAVDPGVRA